MKNTHVTFTRAVSPIGAGGVCAALILALTALVAASCGGGSRPVTDLTRDLQQDISDVSTSSDVPPTPGTDGGILEATPDATVDDGSAAMDPGLSDSGQDLGIDDLATTDIGYEERAPDVSPVEPPPEYVDIPLEIVDLPNQSETGADVGCVPDEALVCCASSEDCTGKMLAVGEDACNPAVCQNGHCMVVPAGPATSCLDGNACTLGDHCETGRERAICVPGTLAPDCDDSDMCTTDRCEPASGCVHEAIVCTDDNPCTDNACAPASGCTITNNSAPCAQAKCADGFFYPAATCSAGSCPALVPVACDDGNVCTDDSCDPTSGCLHADNTASCDDGLPCTVDDGCQGGTCAGSDASCACITNLDCQDDGNLCDGTPICDTSTIPFKCVIDTQTVVACTLDARLSPLCAAIVCEPASGECQTSLSLDGTPCDAGSCAGNDWIAPSTCNTGLCEAGNQTPCDDSNPCTTDTCVPTVGCVGTNNSIECGAATCDGGMFYAAAICSGGACPAQTGVSCDDGNQCTTDSCEAATGCVHANVSDGTECGTGNTCESGQCVAGFCGGTPCPLVSGYTLSCNAQQACEYAGGTGSAMVYVPPGAFWMGANKDGTQCPTNILDSEAAPNELPCHLVTVPGFLVDKYEVTVSLYQTYYNAKGGVACTNPVGGSACTPQDTKFSNYCNWGISGKEEHPVNCVQWVHMDGYCKGTGKRLCSESEWEKAARGTDGRKYPWGKTTATCEYAVMCEGVGGGNGCGTNSTMAVGSKSAGASPYGAMDMSGNVSEWVQDCYDSIYTGAPVDGSALESPACAFRAFRGGGFGFADVLRASVRYADDPGYVRSEYIGSRCCRSLP